jgi:hypothetical protein
MSKLVDKIGQFTTIPNSVIAMWPKIGVDAIALFLYLRYRTNSQTGDAFPSFETIRNDTGLTRKRIAIAAKSLELAGLVERKRRFSASTIYTLKLPDTMDSKPISHDALPMDSAISHDAGLPLVTQVHTNQIDSIKTESSISSSAFKTRDIQSAYQSCVPYKIDWIKGEGSAAKWLAENGYTPDDVIGCYRKLKADKFWSDKPLSLQSVKKQIGEWKSNNVHIEKELVFS